MEAPSQEFDAIGKAVKVRAAGSKCKATEAELRKLQEFEQEAARASNEKSNSDRSHNDSHRQTTAKKPVGNKVNPTNVSSRAPQNATGEPMDPLDLAKILEARLKEDSDARPSKQGLTKNVHPINKDSQDASAMKGMADNTEEPLDLAKIVESRLQDSGLDQSENATTPNGGNSQGATNTSNANCRPGAYAGAPGTDLQRANTLRFSLVGATANGPLVSQTSLSSVHEEEWRVTEAPGKEYVPAESNRGLAVANLVHEDDDIAPEDLPQAKSAVSAIAQSESQQKKHIKQVKTFLLLGFIFVLAVITILVATLSSRNKTVETLMPSPSPTSIPSAAPTSYSEYWLSLFPESTASTILQDSRSPQSMAFEWLMEEIDILQNLTAGRAVQRFVLATFYFANSEEQWLFSDNWLNHSVHECLWYSSLEDYYFFFGADTVFPLDHISPCEQDPAGYLEDGILYQGDGIIKHFWLSLNGLMGSGIPPELYLLTELRSLALDGWNLTSTIPEELSGLPSLEFISMIDCGLFGSIPEALGSLSKLGVLYFLYNSLTGTIPSSLYSLTNSMRGIALLDNQLTGPLPTELGLLTDLQVIGFDANLFTGTIPTELAQLTLLNFLDLPNLMLSGSIPTELAVLTDMAVLQLEDSGLTGTIPRWLANMASLDTLTLEANSFSGTIPTELGLLTKLSVLWLGMNALSGTIPSEFGMYDQAIVLDLELNNLTGTIPTEFGQLTALFQLWLFDNDLTGTVPLELGNVPFPPPYGQVWLHGNDLSGIIPERLCSAQSLYFDCSSQLCGCDLCDCSDNRSVPLLEAGERIVYGVGQLLLWGDGQFLPLSEANQTEGNQTEA
ncbi:LRR receptor-like serine threonine-protein kinase [Seminavis robusta]|uniref:LRR receptor-like serine threonine-protein kinase n=1 Tax=Seminavis robusta TaxID=568900 RepID=A0A9N8HCH6_9STRA|nr:LRR receptor-like serine threonine-protein kinase [Seminavis robusta]|eukprot:Sro410_g137310.1 LRR receptor-like serine threonine-protein kinase (844) ;mRNA; r:4186-7051